MNITDITKKAGAHKKRKRVGRGEGSGWGKTSGRGHKGAGQRSGYNATSLSEGANFPFFRRIPKYGFSNAEFRTEYQVVNLSTLSDRFDAGAHVTPTELEEKGLIGDREKPVKILGDGELTKKMTIEAHRFSKSAEQKIESAGGKTNWLAPRPKKKFIKKPRWQLAAEEAAKGTKKGKPDGKGKKASKEASTEAASADAPSDDASANDE